MNLSELYQISPLQKEIPVFQPCQYYPQDTPSPGTSEGSNDFRILQDTSDTAIDFTSDFKSKSSKNHSPDRKPERYLRKKSKTDAAIVYDQVDINADEAGIYDIEWIPHMEVFNRKSHIRVTWKGSPSNISDLPFYEKLHPGEVHIASTLRLTPEQYLRCKRVLILGAQEASKKNSSFRKSDAQRVCRIDVNKASTLWSVFGRLGWLGPKWPH
ncbi:Homeodomain-like protein [Spinellus fusiger]|nr:Homeodomain-like protein [Spinellus fusiger]